MCTYAELLLDERWREKRKEIINRDTFTCKGCDNNFLLDDFIRGYSSHIPHRVTVYNHEEIQMVIDRYTGFWCYYKEDTYKALRENGFFLIYYETTSDGFSNIYGIKKLPKIIYKTKINPSRYEESIEDLKEEIKKVHDNIEQYISENSNKGEWTYVKGLHVHHKYYRYGWRPWEYPESALITYCWKCHEAIHANEKIPMHDINGILTGNVTPCSRCYGAGVFPEYRHVEAGICFRCKGAQYEELINFEVA